MTWRKQTSDAGCSLTLTDSYLDATLHLDTIDAVQGKARQCNAGSELRCTE